MSKSGWLTKKAVKTLRKDSWKRRWFTLTENMITYSAKKGGSAKNLLVLTAESSVSTTSEHGEAHPYELVVMDSSFTLYACGEDEKTRDGWMTAIQAAINKLNGVGAVDRVAQQRELEERMELLRLQDDARRVETRKAMLERPSEAAAASAKAVSAADNAKKLKRAASVRRRLEVMENTSGKVTSNAETPGGAIAAVVAESTAKAYGAGINSHGQLGNGRTTPGGVARPDEVAVITGRRAPSAIALGSNFAVAITKGGLLAWGDGNSGQLGVADGFSGAIRPFPIPAFRDIRIKSIACGDTHAIVLDSVNNLYAMGSSEHGALGLGSDVKTASTPQLVMAGSSVAAVRANGNNSAAIMSSGDVFVWGSLERGSCGMMVPEGKRLWRPVVLRDSLLSHGVVDIAFAHSFTLILAVDLEAAGRALSGPAASAEEQAAAASRALAAGFQPRWVHPQPGRRSPVPCQLLVCGAPGAPLEHFLEYEAQFSSPHHTRTLADRATATAIAGGRHVAAILAEGSVYMLGTGILGTSTVNAAEVCKEHPLATHNLKALTEETAFEPVRVPDLDLQDITQLAVGSMHTLALTETGQVLGFGANETGVLGTGSCTDTLTPVPAMLLPVTRSTQIAAYDNSSMTVTEFGIASGVTRSRKLAVSVAKKLQERVRASRAVHGGAPAPASASASSAVSCPPAYSMAEALGMNGASLSSRRFSTSGVVKRREEHTTDTAAMLSTLQTEVAKVKEMAEPAEVASASASASCAAVAAASEEGEAAAADYAPSSEEIEADENTRGNWYRHFDEDGTPYYEDLTTNVTQWEAPAVFA